MKSDPYLGLPQNPKKLALNRQFRAKLMKHETPSIHTQTQTT